MARTCLVCGESKSLTSFHKNGLDKTGAVRYRPECKECYNITRKVNAKRSRRTLAKFVGNTKHRTGEQKSLSLGDWKDTMLYFRGCCAYCGVKHHRSTRLTKEHVVPVSQGGATCKQNIIPACKRCNSSKADNDMQDWYKKQLFFDEARLKRIVKWVRK